MKFTYGTDPEVMLGKDDKIYSAIGILKEKDKKTTVGKFGFYYDNVLAECCVPPANSCEEAVETIGKCLKELSKIVSPYKIIIQASHEYDADQLKHKDATKVYCNPERCAYGMKNMELNKNLLKKTSLRSAGGHIHLGSDVFKSKAKNPYACNGYTAIRLLDLFMGIPSIFIDHDPTSKKRRKLYGSAGRCRFTSYGIEYRSIGNFWLATPKLVELMYEISEFVLNLIDSGEDEDFWFLDKEKMSSDDYWDDGFDKFSCHQPKYDVESVKKSINTTNKEMAAKWLRYVKDYLPKKTFSKIEQFSVPKQIDCYKEWSL